MLRYSLAVQGVHRNERISMMEAGNSKYRSTYGSLGLTRSDGLS